MTAFVGWSALSGCGPRPAKPGAPPDASATAEQAADLERRAALGTVGVSAAAFVPELAVQNVAAGSGEGAAQGASGAVKGLWGRCSDIIGNTASSTRGDVQAYAVIFEALACAYVTPFAAAGGAVYGAVAAEPEAQVGQAKTTIWAIKPERMEEVVVKIQGALQERVVQRVAQRTAFAVRPVALRGPARPDERPSYQEQGGRGIGSVLEVSILKMALEAEAFGLNPPLAVGMDAQSRLILVADGSVVSVNTYRYVSDYRPLAGWATDHGDPLRVAIRAGFDHVADQIVTETFLVSTITQPEVLPVEGATPQPTLRWQFPPPRADAKSQLVARLAEAVRYDVRIFRAEAVEGLSSRATATTPVQKRKELATSALTEVIVQRAPVYSRKDLGAISHRVEPSLAPGRYFWTVRARLRLAGQWRITPWAIAPAFDFGDTSTAAYAFDVPGEQKAGPPP